jgi:hypothetical protein
MTGRLCLRGQDLSKHATGMICIHTRAASVSSIFVWQGVPKRTPKPVFVRVKADPRRPTLSHPSPTIAPQIGVLPGKTKRSSGRRQPPKLILGSHARNPKSPTLCWHDILTAKERFGQPAIPLYKPRGLYSGEPVDQTS